MNRINKAMTIIGIVLTLSNVAVAAAALANKDILMTILRFVVAVAWASLVVVMIKLRKET
jgi:hypothetical protein